MSTCVYCTILYTKFVYVSGAYYNVPVLLCVCVCVSLVFGQNATVKVNTSKHIVSIAPLILYQHYEAR